MPARAGLTGAGSSSALSSATCTQAILHEAIVKKSLYVHCRRAARHCLQHSLHAYSTLALD